MTDTSTTTLRAVPAPPTAPVEPTMSTRALDAITVVEASTMFALPIPYHVAFHRHELRVMVHSWDELVTWAMRMDVDVDAGSVLDDGRQHFTATGTLAGAEVTVVTIDRDGSNR